MVLLAERTIQKNFFFINDVLHWGASYFRVIETTPYQVFLFKLDQNSGFPEPYDLDELLLLLSENTIDIVENHNYNRVPLSRIERDKAFEEAENRYLIIKPIVEADEYLWSNVRQRLVKEQIQNDNSKSTIYRLLRDFWSHGQSLESLAPQYHKCGAPGEIRQLTDKKPGPRSVYEINKDRAIRTDAIVLIMNTAITMFYLAKKKTLVYSYRRFITACKLTFVELTDDQIPSIDSFRGLILNYHSLYIRIKSRNHNNVFLKDIRTLFGSATASSIGPGSVYEIDATVADIHTVCEHDRTKILGKPIVYLLIDLFSRYICGFYIGFHNASYRTATISLLSAVQDKTHLLKEYGINEEVCTSWPGVGLPHNLVCDKAELFGLKGSHLSESTGMSIVNTASGRSDAKGVVERYFPIVQKAFEGEVPGKSTSATAKKAGAIDGRLTAIFTLREVQEIIISEIVVRNNLHIMDSYDSEVGMPDDMKLTPKNVWDWGTQNRTGKQTQVDIEALKVAVLPRGTARVSREGVRFNGLLYRSDELDKFGWFLRIKDHPSRPVSVEVLYDPMLVNHVYVLIPDSKTPPILVGLKPHFRTYIDCSFAEVKERLFIRKATSKKHTITEENAIRELEEKRIKIEKNALKQKKQMAKKSVAQTKREIPENRNKAKNEERIKLIDNFSPKQELLDHTELVSNETHDEFVNPEIEALFKLDKDVNYETTENDDEHEN
jgi:putative transposase